MQHLDEPAAARWIEQVVRDAFADESRTVVDALVREHSSREFRFVRVRDRVVIASVIGSRAWIFGTAPIDDAARDLPHGWHFGAGVTAVITGGPPRGYLQSGLRKSDCEWFAREGFVERSRHVELRVTLAMPRESDPRVRRARRDECEALSQWITALFSSAWASEVRTALERDGVFVAGTMGFAAHSGNNAARGNFGPIGVAKDSRGEGIGHALARASLDDLYARGFRTATIPWVDRALIPFYASLVETIDVHERIVMGRESGA